MSRFKQLFFRKSIWKGLFTIAVFMLVFFVSAPAYSVAAKRVDQTTQDEIAGSADADDDTFDLDISSNLGSTLSGINPADIDHADDPGTGAFNTDHGDFVYQNYRCISFPAYGDRYPDHTAESGSCWSGSFHDDRNHDTGIYTGI